MEGYGEFKDDFARWYLDSLERHMCMDTVQEPRGFAPTRRKEETRSKIAPDLAQPRVAGPAGWELSEIKLELDELNASRSRRRSSGRGTEDRGLDSCFAEGRACGSHPEPRQNPLGG